VGYVDTTYKNDEEKKIALQELHQQAIKREQQDAYKKEREQAKTQMISDALNTKDKGERDKLQLTLKLANFSDYVRQAAEKGGADISDLKDEEVVSKYVE